MDNIEILGFAATGLATLAFLPQVIKTLRTQSAHDFSLVTLVMLVAGTGIWIAYGLLRGAPAIWLGNAVTLGLTGLILLVKTRNSLADRGAAPSATTHASTRPRDPALCEGR